MSESHDDPIKVVPVTTMVSVHMTAQIPQIGPLAEDTMPELFAAIAQAGLKQSGPVVFHYYNMTDDPDETFEMEMAVPVEDAAAVELPDGIELKEYDEFTCTTDIHRGSMKEIDASWKILTKRSLDAGHEETTHTREVYLTWVDFDSQENVTELQMEIR